MKYEKGQYVRAYHKDDPGDIIFGEICFVSDTKNNKFLGMEEYIISAYCKKYGIFSFSTDPMFWNIDILDVDEMQFKLLSE